MEVITQSTNENHFWGSTHINHFVKMCIFFICTFRTLIFGEPPSRCLRPEVGPLSLSIAGPKEGGFAPSP